MRSFDWRLKDFIDSIVVGAVHAVEDCLDSLSGFIVVAVVVVCLESALVRNFVVDALNFCPHFLLDEQALIRDVVATGYLDKCHDVL